MPIETVTINATRYQCDRCPTATRSERNAQTLAALNPGWTLTNAATLCPRCSRTDNARRIPGKSLRAMFGATLGDPLDVASVWRVAAGVAVNADLVAADALEMRFTPVGDVRQTYTAIGAALGISANRARALVLHAVYRCRSEMRWMAERAAAFDEHCARHHHADFEVCSESRCRSVVAEEKRRGEQ